MFNTVIYKKVNCSSGTNTVRPIADFEHLLRDYLVGGVYVQKGRLGSTFRRIPYARVPDLSTPLYVITLNTYHGNEHQSPGNITVAYAVTSRSCHLDLIRSCLKRPRKGDMNVLPRLPNGCRQIICHYRHYHHHCHMYAFKWNIDSFSPPVIVIASKQ